MKRNSTVIVPIQSMPISSITVVLRASCFHIVLLQGSLLLSGGSASASILVDDFTSGAQSILGSGSSTVAAPVALGGGRFMGSVGFSTGGTSSVDTAAAQLFHQNPASNSFPVWAVVIDWRGEPPYTGLDVTEGGTNDRFTVAVSEVSGTGNVGIGVTDTSGEFMGFGSFNFSQGAGLQTISFSSFHPNPGVPLIDFTNVGAVRMQLNADVGSSIAIGRVSIVPEPGSALLLSVGFFVLLGGRVFLPSSSFSSFVDRYA